MSHVYLFSSGELAESSFYRSATRAIAFGRMLRRRRSKTGRSVSPVPGVPIEWEEEVKRTGKGKAVHNPDSAATDRRDTVQEYQNWRMNTLMNVTSI
jgi:hypothetical protein